MRSGMSVRATTRDMARRGALALVLVCVVGAGRAEAQGEPGGWLLTPFLGIGFGGNLENAPATGGVAFGYSGPRIGFEFELARLHAEQGFPIAFETNVWSYAVNGIYSFTDDRGFTPYALAGIAWQRASADLSALPGGPFPFDDTTTEASFNIGVGLRTMLSEQAGLRIDLRYTNGNDLAPDFWRIAAGFVWRFGVR